MWDKRRLIAKICAGYDTEIRRQRCLLERYWLERAELILAAEGLQAHGGAEAANDFKPRLNYLERKIRASERLLARMEELHRIYQAQLRQVQPTSPTTSRSFFR